MNEKVLIVGWAEDVGSVARKLPFLVRALHESTREEEIPKAIDTAVYVFSRDTGSSSQLLSLISYIHAGIMPRCEYVVSLEDVDLSTQVFPVIADVPEISIEALCSLGGGK